MLDEGLSVPMSVAAYDKADPRQVEALAAGADAHLCDSVDYRKTLEPWGVTDE